MQCSRAINTNFKPSILSEDYHSFAKKILVVTMRILCSCLYEDYHDFATKILVQTTRILCSYQNCLMCSTGGTTLQ